MPKSNGPGAAATATGTGGVEAGAPTPTDSPVTLDGQLRSLIRLHLPNADGEELEHRVALLKAREYAARLRGDTASQTAFDLAVSAHEWAGAFVYAERETVQRLSFAAKLCRRLVSAAMLARQLEEGEAAGG